MAALRSTRIGWGLFLTFAVLGFLLVLQFRTHQQVEADLASMSVDELSVLVATLSRESERLQAEVVDLRLELIGSQYARKTDAEMVDERRRSRDELELVTGAISAVGPGVRMVLTDTRGSLVGPYDMCEIINELRVAAARAIAVNGHRVDFNTGFSEGAAGILMSGRHISPPYDIVALGNPAELHSALLMPGGLAARLGSLPGVHVEVHRQEQLHVPSVDRTPLFQYATRVED
jgi:uncharacterized protein YlxW (UPF0749 family)